MPSLNAQTVAPNIKINTSYYDEVSADGGSKSIAVFENNVSTVWQGFPDESSSNIYFAKSIDGGISFSSEVSLTESENSVINMFPAVAVDNNGNNFVTWTKWSVQQDSVFLGPRSFNGYIDELRVWKDTALWVSNFTPPSSPYQVTNNPRLKLFLNMEESNLPDNSLSDHTTILNGNLTQNNTDAKFGIGSAYFDGTGSTYLSVPLNDDFNFETGDFTVDYWVKFETLSTLDFVFADSVDGNGSTSSIYGTGMNFYFYNPQNTICYSNNGTYIGDTYDTWYPSTNQWYHVAGVRNGNTWMVYIDGNLVNTGSYDGSVESNYSTETSIMLSRSFDGGNTFQAPQQITTINSDIYSSIGVFEDNLYLFYANGSNYPLADYYFIRSTNLGNSFENPIQINDAPCISSVEFDKVTSLDIDDMGSIYLAWVDGRRANSNGDIFFAKSTDNGQSFTSNIMVNDINQSGADSVQYIPSIAVDASNNVYVSFADKRLGRYDWSGTRVYLAKSSDGGSTFATESILAGHDQTCKYHDIAADANGNFSAALATPNIGNWGVWLFESTDGGYSFLSPVALSDAFNNDYSYVHLVLNTDEEAFALWRDDRLGYENIYFANTELGAQIGDSELLDEYIIYPNPTNREFIIEMPDNNMNIEISICNVQGQIIYEKSYSNPTVINIDIDFQQGIYFVNVTSAINTKTLKLIKQ